MARYYGVLTGLTVQSAAASSSAVAPNSIASIYGPIPVAAPVQAGTQPLPMSLGGVTVTVQDAAGTQRQAPLIYVSPSQINFNEPDCTAAGAETLTVANGSTSSTTAGRGDTEMHAVCDVTRDGEID